MTDVAISLLTPVLLGFLIGAYLDKRLLLKFPIFSISLPIVGSFLGMYALYKKYSK